MTTGEIPPALDTKRKLLHLLKVQGELPVDDMARSVGVTLMAVRKHVACLERDGLLQSRLEKRPKGRPRYVYSLTPAASSLFPQSYAELITVILDDIREQGGPREVRALFECRARKMAARYSLRLQDCSTLEEKVAALAELRAEEGFMASYRRDEDGLLLEQHNCPLLQVAEANHEACATEIDMFRQLLGDEADVHREHWMAGGDGVCSYRIEPSEVSHHSSSATDSLPLTATSVSSPS
jgi:predicted ArsR family transcriptional regulator